MVVLVFVSVVYGLRLFLGALLLPRDTTAPPSGGAQGGPSPAQWEALLADLRALRMEVQGTRSCVGGCAGTCVALCFQFIRPFHLSPRQSCGAR